jgi:hypothetical protein
MAVENAWHQPKIREINRRKLGRLHIPTDLDNPAVLHLHIEGTSEAPARVEDVGFPQYVPVKGGHRVAPKRSLLRLAGAV